MNRLTPLYIAKFWMKVKPDPTSKNLRSQNKWLGKCWIWQGSCFLSGYGRFSIHQKVYRAHHISYYLYNGTLPENFYICHKCDNPRCINPLHLWAGTPKDNVNDMIKKGRQNNFRAKGSNVSSKYYGITFRKDNKKWRARYMNNYINILIGEFETEEEAAKAYDKAIIENKLNRKLNF